MILKGFADAPQRGIGQVEGIHVGELGFIFTTNWSLGDIRKALANNKRWQEAKTGQISDVDLMLPSGLVGMDPSQTSFFQLLRTETKIDCWLSWTER